MWKSSIANVNNEKTSFSVVVFGLGLGGTHPVGHPDRCVCLFRLALFCWALRLRVLEALKAPVLKTIAKSSCLEGI